MGTELAKEVIELRDREKARQGNFRNLYQSVANLIFPQTYGINTQYAPGEELMTELFDTTAVEEAENMASGITNNLFPPGQPFFALSATGTGYEDDPESEEYLAYLTDETHQQMANSNFQAQVGNTIHYWLVFGMGAIYSDWTAKDGLSYRDYAVGTYQCLENSKGQIDTIILSCPMTARQLYQDYGPGAGKSVVEAYGRPDSRGNVFDVIHIVRPRKDFDPNPVLRPADRAPFQSVFVQEKDQIVLNEGGFDEFPFAVPRYSVVYREVCGRGRGVALLPQVRVLNRLAKDYLDMANKWVAPPLEVLESFEGTVDLSPLAQNFVLERDTIRPINMGSNGMYPVTKDILEYYREGIRQGFFKGAFEPVTPLSGDRRTTTEIIERLKEGMKKLNKPMARLFTELLEPEIRRTVSLLIRNGVVQPPPFPIQTEIEFINPLALALRDQQSRGLQYWVSAGIDMAQAFPMVVDNVDSDRAYRDLGRSLGVKSDHIRSVRDRDEIRAQRQQQQQAMQAAEMAGAAAEGYGKITKAPEPGSPAEALIGE